MENEEIKKIDNEVYKCPGCGNNLTYNPDTAMLTCEYCHQTIKIDGQKSNQENDFLNAPQLNNWKDEVHVIHCQNCGSDTVKDIKSMSNTCPYCGSSSVVDSDQLPGEKPHRVIPFTISAEQSFQLYSNWLKKKFFVPRVVKKNIPNPVANPVYIPSWTYDTMTYSSYEGRLGEHYTVVVGSGKNARTVTKTRYFRIRGVLNLFHDDILVCSGQKIDQKELEKIAPYQTNNSFVYDPRYLSGFSAEHYSITVQQGWNRARDLAQKRIRAAILRQYHHDVVDYLNVKTNYANITYKYVLLPVWLCKYKVRNKSYDFKVNGETGKIVGKIPYSGLKIFLVIFISLAIIIALLLIYYYSADPTITITP